MASATSHTGMHTKARQALSDTATHHHAGMHMRSRQAVNDTASHHHSNMHTKPRQAVSDTAAHQHGNQTTHESYGNHANNNSNRKPAVSRHLGPVRGEGFFFKLCLIYFYLFLGDLW